MTGNAAFFKTPHGRLLIGLGAATLLALLATGFALMREARLSQRQFEPEPVFPHLNIGLADAASIRIVSKTGEIEIKRSGDDPKSGYWVVPEAHGYPADQERVRRLLLGLADLKAVEKKTARPDWHDALSLGDPKNGGNAITLTVTDSKDQTLAALLVGKLKPGGPKAEPMVYVRRAGENQSYLAQGDLPLETARADWLDSGIVDIARDRVKRVTVAPRGFTGYTVSRASPEEPNFQLENLPKGRQMLSETAANATGAAAVAVSLDDIRPVGEVDFSKASEIAFETFDGLTVRFAVTEKNEQAYIRVSAEGANPKAAEEAEIITARTQGWAYAVPSWKATVFTKPLSQLLKTPEKK